MQDFDHLRDLLLQQRAQAFSRASDLDAAADDITRSRSGEVRPSGEGSDGDPDSVERGALLTLSSAARKAVEDIDRALARIEAGTYGTCESCEQPIPLERLQARPRSTHCVSCSGARRWCS